MPLFKLGVLCVITARNGSDIYGQPKYDAPVNAYCSVIKFKVSRQHSTVRADSSGSRGHADEVVADVKLLMNVEPSLDDRLVVRAQRLRVLSVMPRFTVMGKLDHFEVEATIE